MSEKLLLPSDLDRILREKGKNIILHTMDGDIVGASQQACSELGYTAEEITQIVLANIKAHTLRLSDLCLNQNDVDTPTIFGRRNGKRFPAKVTS